MSERLVVVSNMKPQERTTKSSSFGEDGIGSTKKSDGVDIAMQKLNRKIFELELCQRMAHETEVRLRRMERKLLDEKRMLDQQEYGKLEKIEAFCDEIWRFTSSNDLYASFNKYLDMPKRAHWKFSVHDIELDPDIIQLKSENDKLRSRLTKKKSTRRNLEKSLLELDMELKIAESYRDKNPEIIRLKKCIEECEENIDALNVKIVSIEMENSKGNRQRESIANVIEDKKYDFVTASELIEKFEILDTTKRSKFSVKKESNVSRKLANRKKRVE